MLGKGEHGLTYIFCPEFGTGNDPDQSTDTSSTTSQENERYCDFLPQAQLELVDHEQR